MAGLGRTLALVAAAALSAGCVRFQWSRAVRETPPARDALATLEGRHATLDACLAALGAPLYAWEYKGDGVALAYGWVEEDVRGFTVSVPVADQASASFSYDDSDERLRGAVLLFDENLALEQVRRGYLRDLSREFDRRRPSVSEP